MSKTITVTEMSRSLADIMNRVAYRGESFIVMKGKRVMAEVVPPKKIATISDLARFFEKRPHLHLDDVEQFAKDIEEARCSVPKEDYDPWER